MSEQPEAIRLAAVCDLGHPLEDDVALIGPELLRLHAVESGAKVELMRRDNLIDSLNGLCESYRTQVESLTRELYQATNPPFTGKTDSWQAACGKARTERDEARAQVESLQAASAEWSPAYTRGQARQSAPVAAVPAMVTDAALIRELVDHIERNTCTHEGTHRGGAIWEVCDSCGARWADDEGGKPEFKWPAVVEKARAILALRPERVPLTEEQMISAVRPLCNTDQVAERLVAVSIDEYRAIEAASARLNDLAVGDGAQPIKDTP